jgi:hypothetical protein
MLRNEKMIEGLDYCYIYPKDDGSAVHIKLLEGPYKDTIFKYGKVKFKEENNQVYLLFAYDVLESKVSKPKKLEKDETFKNYIGDLLVEIMSSNIEQEVVDETGTNHTEESDPQ